MAFYSIRFSESFQKDINKIPQKDRKKLLARIDKIAIEPRPYGYEKLSGIEYYRVRQGNYRILYSIQDRELTIWIIKIGHRKDIYR
jgi:mRNA interferase RelE/StbE